MVLHQYVNTAMSSFWECVYFLQFSLNQQVIFVIKVSFLGEKATANSLPCAPISGLGLVPLQRLESCPVIYTQNHKSLTD